MTPVRTARRIDNVTYAVRDVVLWAREAQAAGRDLIYLNIGDPCQFDFKTPPHVVEAIVRGLRENRTSYTPSEGIPEAVEAIRRDAEERKGIRAIRYILIGHGASEPIETLLTTLLEPGEGVLVPSPGYPLYTAVLSKLEARAIPYHLDESRGWQPDPDEIEARVDEGCRAIVLINPNNPTGSVAGPETIGRILDIAAANGLVVLCDEIYDQMLLDPGTRLTSGAALRDDVPIATFYGLSKVWLGPGLRVGWCVLSGPERAVAPLVDAMGRLARARLCASHPVQCAIPAALTGPQEHIREANARLARRRDITVRHINAIPGWSIVRPEGAFYAFPRVDLGVDDVELVRRLVLEEGVVLVHGTGFGQREGTQHVRIVFLPPENLLEEAYRRIERFSRSLG
ncbi:MAG: aminotransferase class I/II-fold pyridoxal phosphate-dependent enzyme [Acidobacteria bacterium]|nr:aminotransferase class I/II-fold pyridoxal phosphate-dependent enzyme [Acidobacteriota bacterium]